jgi:hypothetical protein
MSSCYRFLGGLFIVGWLSVACTTNEAPTEDATPIPVEGEIEKAVAQMRALSSYRSTVTTTASAGERQEKEWVIDYEGKDRYRIAAVAELDRPQILEYCGSLGGSLAKSCETVAGSFAGAAVSESVLYDGDLFARFCGGYGSATCTPWVDVGKDERLPGPGWFRHPESVMIALTTATDVEAVESSTHMRGTVNPMKVRMETAKYVFGEQLTDSDYVRCEFGGGVDSNQENFEVEPSCRDIPDPGETIAERIKYYEENPVTMEVWVSESDGLIGRVSFTEDPGESGVREVTRVEYSLYNQAVVEAPSTGATRTER